MNYFLQTWYVELRQSKSRITRIVEVSMRSNDTLQMKDRCKVLGSRSHALDMCYTSPNVASKISVGEEREKQQLAARVPQGEDLK